ncbi:MAG: hypothetical protein NWF00_00540 [Candidatus Bathyarchaeota archaeon]|nr:hypothetical protein [Candidatus Bathyarchaeota archaeon]
MSKSRGINADIQSPRTKLLYFIYSAPHNRIKAEPGVKSTICAALGYKSDGHFHYDWNYLVNAGMLEEKQGYFAVTDEGKNEFVLHSTVSRSSSVFVVTGIILVFFTFLLLWQIVPVESVAAFGIALIFLGFLFSMVNRRNQPELPLKARVLLKELSRR